jgi:Asp-tRNA(Asn)/Glu-tRNA(Gln) amidotransferase A subunit family amidase
MGLRQPQSSNQGVHRGPFEGGSHRIKDIMSMYTNLKELKVDTKDFPTEHGSPFHKGERPGVDAPLVRILREAGAHIIGKTVCPYNMPG